MKTHEIKITPEEFERAVAQLKAEGRGQLNAGEDHQGMANYRGVIAAFHYDRETQVLTIILLHKPWIYPEADVWSKVDEWFQGRA